MLSGYGTSCLAARFKICDITDMYSGVRMQASVPLFMLAMGFTFLARYRWANNSPSSHAIAIAAVFFGGVVLTIVSVLSVLWAHRTELHYHYHPEDRPLDKGPAVTSSVDDPAGGMARRGGRLLDQWGKGGRTAGSAGLPKRTGSNSSTVYGSGLGLGGLGNMMTPMSTPGRGDKGTPRHSKPAQSVASYQTRAGKPKTLGRRPSVEGPT